MHARGSLNTVFATLLAIVLAAIAGVIVWQAATEDETADDVVTLNVNTAATTPDTSDWQTYRNNDLGFLMDYPADWIVTVSDVGTAVTAEPTDLGGAATGFTVDVRDITWNDYVAEKQADDPAYAVVSQTDTLLEGYAATAYATTNAAGTQLTTIFCRHNDQSTIITFRTDDNATQEAIRESFQFTDGDTSDMVTYANTDLDFLIALPDGWSVDTDRTSDDEIVFTNGLVSEARESVLSTVTDQTIDEWISGREDVVSSDDYILDDVGGKRMQVAGIGGDFIVAQNGDRLFVLTVGRMESNGMLATFQFLNPAVGEYLLQYTDEVADCTIDECLNDVYGDQSYYEGVATIKGYYTQKIDTSWDANELCDNFVVTGGSEAYRASIQTRLDQGNTVNYLDDSGNPAIHLDLSGISTSNTDLVQQSTADAPIRLVLYIRPLTATEAPACYAEADILNVSL